MLSNFGIIMATVYSLITPLIIPILFFLYSIGIKYYIVRNDNEKTRAIVKSIQKTALSSSTTFQCGTFYPSGYFVNRNCIGYCDYNDAYEGVSAIIYIITTPAYFEQMSATEQVAISFSTDETNKDVSSAVKALTKTSMVIYTRSGTYSGIYYSRLRTDVHDLEPLESQKKIVDDICQRFIQKRRGVFFIHGASGVGKSTIGYLVAKRLNGVFCHTFNPTDPGDTLALVAREADPSNERPTIILLEEANMMIRSAHDGNVPRHKNITTCVRDKSTYNTFMDDLIFYKHVLIIMTSNESKESIDQLDPCYLRKGRVEEYYNL